MAVGPTSKRLESLYPRRVLKAGISVAYIEYGWERIANHATVEIAPSQQEHTKWIRFLRYLGEVSIPYRKCRVRYVSAARVWARGMGNKRDIIEYEYEMRAVGWSIEIHLRMPPLNEFCEWECIDSIAQALIKAGLGVHIEYESNHKDHLYLPRAR